jgi:hypothetical protein
MRDKNEVLAELQHARTTYKDFLAAVDADLAAEKQKRLATRQGEILHLVAEAFANGANINQIKRAYGTKDYKTIRSIIDSMGAEVKALEAEVKYETKPTWTLQQRGDTLFVDAGTSTYQVVDLEGHEYLLDLDSGDNELYADGEILNAGSTGILGQIYKALEEGKHYDD